MRKYIPSSAYDELGVGGKARCRQVVGVSISCYSSEGQMRKCIASSANEELGMERKRGVGRLSCRSIHVTRSLLGSLSSHHNMSPIAFGCLVCVHLIGLSYSPTAAPRYAASSSGGHLRREARRLRPPCLEHMQWHECA